MSDTPATGPTEADDTARDTPGRAGGPTVSLGEAVKVTGAARSTLQRRLHTGAIDGAERGSDGGWRIPIAGLIAAGFMPRISPPDTPPAPVPDPFPPAGTAPREAELTARLVRLEAELEKERAVREAMERNLAGLERALEAMSRALPPGPATETEQAPPRRRRWWRSS